MIGADRFIHLLNDERQIKHAEQRYAQGLSDIDMWNFDSFLADVIVAGCNWYLSDRSMTSGPWGLEEGQWEEILRTIRDGFSRRNSSNEADPTDEAWDLLREHFHNFWD